MVKNSIITALLAAVVPFLTGCGSVNPSGPGITKLDLKANEGPEDLDIIQIDGKDRLMISSLDYGAKFRKTNGHIWLLSEDGKRIDGPVPIVDESDTRLKSFRPHGIHVVNNPPEKPLVYVVNHVAGGDRIQAFSYEAGKLVLDPAKDWEVTPNRCNKIKHKLNDVFALPDGRVYTTEFMAGKIWYRNPNQEALGWQALKSATASNGLHIEDNHLYVASGLNGKICKYELSRENGAPDTAPNKFTSLQGALDNFGYYDGTDSLLASHERQGSLLLNNLLGLNLPTPTRVYRVNFSNGKNRKELRLKKGEKRIPIEDGSTAVKLGDHIYFGQVFGNHVLKVATNQIVEIDYSPCGN